MRIAIVHVIDAIAAAKVAAHVNRIFTHLLRHATVKRDSVRGAVHDFDQVLPAVKRGHDLLRSAAQRKGRIVGMKREPHIGFLRDRNDGLEKISDVGPHLIESMRAFVRKRGKVLHPVVVDAGQARRRLGRSLRNSPPWRDARRSCIRRPASRPGPRPESTAVIFSISSSRPGRP